VRSLLIDNSYRALWPDLEEWAGPRQERLWAIYLTEVRERWLASRDPKNGRPYIYALTAANLYHRIADEFLPLFANPDREEDYQLLWVAPPLADALAHLGRWDEVEALFTSALRVWPTGEDVNALNLLANRGRMRYYKGDLEGAVTDLRNALADPGVANGEVSTNSATSIHFYLACALHALGRSNEALASVAMVRGHGSVQSQANLLLCQDRDDEALTYLLRSLEDEHQRDNVIGYAQLENEPPFPGERNRLLRERRLALARNPALIDEVEKYGRILTYRFGEGAAAVMQAPEQTPI
jgi:tetratricopeptide (TPR) repeat protein